MSEFTVENYNQYFKLLEQLKKTAKEKTSFYIKSLFGITEEDFWINSITFNPKIIICDVDSNYFIRDIGAIRGIYNFPSNIVSLTFDEITEMVKDSRITKEIR